MRPNNINVSVHSAGDEVLAWLSVWSEVQMVCIWHSWRHWHRVVACFIKNQTRLTFLGVSVPNLSWKTGH